MFPDRLDAIETWFRTHEDGEFSAYPVDLKSTRDGAFQEAKTVLYTTKPHCLPRIDGLAGFPKPVASIGRYGLPRTEDLSSLSEQSKTVVRLFVGDADPPDILVFSWLREHVPITWYGVNDELLDRHGNRDNTAIVLALTADEMAAVPQLAQFCPDYRQLLGPYCASLLDRGLKIEVEGAIVQMC